MCLVSMPSSKFMRLNSLASAMQFLFRAFPFAHRAWPDLGVPRAMCYSVVSEGKRHFCLSLMLFLPNTGDSVTLNP